MTRQAGLSQLALQRNVQFLYEEQLARVELEAFGCSDVRRDKDDPWTVRAHINGTSRSIRDRAAYWYSIDGTPTIYSDLIRPRYQGGRFNRTRSVNQYLTHWIYPYRGKFHPQMVRALLNILGVRRGSTVLDCFVGSGTAALEASLLGADFVGTDISPLCVLLTRVKTTAFYYRDDIKAKVNTLLKRSSLSPDRVDAAREKNPAVRDFLEVARMVTYSDVARRRRDGDAWLRRNLQNMLESVDDQERATTEMQIALGNVRAVVADARDLTTASIKSNSIDAVVTSPPYSIALDYVKNDEHALEALNVDVSKLRTTMTGVRGRGAKEKLTLYNEDMQRVFREVARVLKPEAGAAFVIGDATVDGREYTTTTTMAEWAADAGLVHDRTLRKVVYGLYSVMQDEKILLFRKPKA